MKKPQTLNPEVGAYLADVRLQDVPLPDYMRGFAKHFKVDLDHACELLKEWLRAVYGGKRVRPEIAEPDEEYTGPDEMDLARDEAIRQDEERTPIDHEDFLP